MESLLFYYDEWIEGTKLATEVYTRFIIIRVAV